MKYFELSTSGSFQDSSLCILENNPEGVGNKSYYLSDGIKMGENFPKDVEYHMDDENPGTRLCHLIGNMCDYLLLSKSIVDILQKECGNEIEYLPFTLIDHKKNLASSDYFIVNPIGTYDCLNEEESEIEYTRNGKPMEPEAFIIDPDKMDQAPHLFRVKDFSSTYIIDSYLIGKIKSQKYSNLNIIYTELESVPSDKEDIEKRKFAEKAKKLELAALEGNIEQVKAMTASGIPVNNKTWEDADRAGVPYNTPLSAAVMGGHRDIIDFLLDEGAPVNEINCKSTTAFIEAVKKGNLETIKKLVDAGADVHQAGKSGNAIIHLFKKNRDAYGESCDYDILKYLLDCGVDPSGILSEYKYHHDNIKLNNDDIPIRKPYLDILNLLQILADNWENGRGKIETLITKCNIVIQKIKDKKAAPPKKPTASKEKIEKVKTIVLDIFHGTFDVDWDEDEILNTCVMDAFEETSDGFYDYTREVFDLDDYDDKDELRDIFEGTVSEIIHKIAEVWDGQKK